MSMEIIKEAAKVAFEKKAEHLVVLDLKPQEDTCDYQLICSVENEIQAKTIVDSIERHCAETLKVKPVCVDGRVNAQWIAMDYGSVIIHVFLKNLRNYYALERLWPKATFQPEEGETHESV